MQDLIVFFRNSPMPSFFLDKKKQVLHINKSAQKFLDLSAVNKRYSVIEGKINCFDHRDDAKGCSLNRACKKCLVRDGASRAFRTGRPVYRKTGKISLPGKVRAYACKISVVPLRIRGRYYAYIWLEDLFKEQNLRDQLKHNVLDFSRAQEAAKVGSWYMDMKKDQLSGSDETCRIFGFPLKKNFKYGKFLGIIHPVDRELFVGAKIKAALVKKPYDIEHRILVDKKVKWIKIRAEFECDKNGRPLRAHGVVQDITVQKLADLDRRQLQDELAYISRHTLMGEFSSALVHELNQPLAAMLSNAQAARRFMSTQALNIDEVRNIIADIIKDSNRAADIIKKLRSLLNKDEIKLQAVDIQNILSEVVSLVADYLILKGVVLDLDFNSSIPPVLADRIQLQQVMVNVIHNACDAMHSADKKLIQLRAEERGRVVLVTIRDTGTGFSEKDINTVFKPFYTTKPGGMGMGLSVSRRILDSHNGRIWAQNHPEGGAVISIELCKATGGTT